MPCSPPQGRVRAAMLRARDSPQRPGAVQLWGTANRTPPHWAGGSNSSTSPSAPRYATADRTQQDDRVRIARHDSFAVPLILDGFPFRDVSKVGPDIVEALEYGDLFFEGAPRLLDAVSKAQPLDRIRRIRIRKYPVGALITDILTRTAHTHGDTSLGRVVGRLAGLPRHPLPMYWYDRVPNFGDALGPVIVEHLSGRMPVLVLPRYEGKLLAVGSVLHRLAAADFVWGAGAIQEEPITPPPNVRFHAVRGPLTRQLIRADVPETYGDPAMLLPLIYEPRAIKRYQLGLVPHYRDRDFVRSDDPSISKIDVQADWHEVVEGITACHAILSSSLHGLIIAEAYGIPAAWMIVGNRLKGGRFKFHDYYLATGREPPEPLHWERAIGLADSRLREPPPFDAEPLLRAWPAELGLASEPGDGG
jgi:pyruvyltransferase